MKTNKVFVTLSLAALMVIAGCSKSAPAPDSIIGFIPADTPYVFANLEPYPQAMIEEWQDKFGSLSVQYENAVSEGIAGLEKKSKKNKKPAAKWTLAILKELQGKISLDGMRSLGLDTDLHAAIYGLGVVPVIRVELKNPDAFRDFVARVEKRAGESIQTGKVGDQSYWTFEGEESPLRAVLAVVGNYLVATLAPKESSDDVLEQLLGLTAPSESLANSDKLGDLNKQYGFTNYGSGYFDVVAFATRIMDKDGGLDRVFFDAVRKDEMNFEITAQCRTEVLSIANKFPRLVAGYDELSAKYMEGRVVAEASPALAKELVKLSTPVPGLSMKSDALASFGFGINIQAAVDFAQAQAKAVKDVPYQCEELLSLNKSVAEAATGLNSPAVMMAAPMASGFLARLSHLDMEATEPTQMYKGKVLLASPDPQALMAMATSMLPQIAKLNLAANGKPVVIDSAELPAGTPPLHAALTENVIAIAVGDGEQSTLLDFANAKVDSLQPLFAAQYQGVLLKQWFEYMGKQIEKSAASGDDKKVQELKDTMQMAQVYGDVLKNTGMQIVISERGIEFIQFAQMD